MVKVELKNFEIVNRSPVIVKVTDVDKEFFGLFSLDKISDDVNIIHIYAINLDGVYKAELSNGGELYLFICVYNCKRDEKYIFGEKSYDYTVYDKNKEPISCIFLVEEDNILRSVYEDGKSHYYCSYYYEDDNLMKQITCPFYDDVEVCYTKNEDLYIVIMTNNTKVLEFKTQKEVMEYKMEKGLCEYAKYFIEQKNKISELENKIKL